MDKGTIIKWSILAIVLIIVAVALYAAFAKKTTVSHTGGGSEAHGGIGTAILALIGL